MQRALSQTVFSVIQSLIQVFFFLMPLCVESIVVTETLRSFIESLKIWLARLAASNSWVTWATEQRSHCWTQTGCLYPRRHGQVWFTAHKPQSWAWGIIGCGFCSMKTNGKSFLKGNQCSINQDFVFDSVWLDRCHCFFLAGCCLGLTYFTTRTDHLCF